MFVTHRTQESRFNTMREHENIFMRRFHSLRLEIWDAGTNGTWDTTHDSILLDNSNVKALDVSYVSIMSEFQVGKGYNLVADSNIVNGLWDMFDNRAKSSVVGYIYKQGSVEPIEQIMIVGSLDWKNRDVPVLGKKPLPKRKKIGSRVYDFLLGNNERDKVLPPLESIFG